MLYLAIMDVTRKWIGREQNWGQSALSRPHWPAFALKSNFFLPEGRRLEKSLHKIIDRPYIKIITEFKAIYFSV
jgi:hypothetical protein